MSTQTGMARILGKLTLLLAALGGVFGGCSAAPPPACDSDAQCPTRGRCQAGICSCPLGYHLEGDGCLPLTCNDLDCASQLRTCNDRQFVAACTGCLPGYVAEADTCVPQICDETACGEGCGADRHDADADGIPDLCDACPRDAPPEDTDVDGVCNSDDLCAAGPDDVDSDADGIPDACDRCPNDGPPEDTDFDGVCDSDDRCPGGIDAQDADGDGVPDACDKCPQDPAGSDDGDFDGICNSDDLCPLGANDADEDADGIPDACDKCPLDAFFGDSDFDGVCDSDDRCEGGNDHLDLDGDGIPNACDTCGPEALEHDSDGDGVADGCDLCPTGNDRNDADGDGVADACDACPGGDDLQDTDLDGVPDACDACPNQPDTVDQDGDGIADLCDACPRGANDLDADFDGIADACDACPNQPDDVDADGDGVADLCDVCPGADDTLDSDGDGVPNGCDCAADIDAIAAQDRLMWLDAAATSTLSLSGGRVSAWRSKTGDAVLEQDDAAARPTYVDAAINGRGVVVFAPTPEFLQLEDFFDLDGGADVTAFVVAQAEEAGGMVTMRSASDPPHLAFSLQVDALERLRLAFLQPLSLPASALAVLHTPPQTHPFGRLLVSTFVGGAQEEILRLFLNGYLGAWTPYAFHGVYAQDLTLMVGKRVSTEEEGDNGGETPFAGTIAEILLYNARLTEADMASVNAYLRQKWQLPGYERCF